MSAHDYYKTTLVFLKDNKMFMFLILSLSGGNLYQAITPTAPKEIAKVESKQCAEACVARIKKLERWHK